MGDLHRFVDADLSMIVPAMDSTQSFLRSKRSPSAARRFTSCSSRWIYGDGLLAVAALGLLKTGQRLTRVFGEAH
jgi:hypothetical protein